VYSSGYLGNLGAITALVSARTLLVLDAHAHASLIDAARLSGAETVVAPHSDPTALAELLDSHPGRRVVVVIESVYSVDGDLAPVAQLHTICRAHGALLLVDEAHAVGALGPDGGGVVSGSGLAGEPDVVVTATLSKALGGAGGVVAGGAALIRHLIDTSRPFIFDTALPPAVAAGVRTALRLARNSDQLRATVTQRASHAFTVLRGAGFAVVAPAAGVLSVLAPSATCATQWAAACREQGVAVGCFRPPSTPDRQSRLRLTVNAGVSQPEFARALDVVIATAPSAAQQNERATA
jgi:8-amino-7-oxononanoate synthase